MFNTFSYPVQYRATFEDGTTKRFECYTQKGCWNQMLKYADDTDKDLAKWEDVSPNATPAGHILD